MSVYKQGDRKYDDGKDEGKKKKNPLDEMGAAAEKGLNEMAKNFSNFFGGKEKKWEKKGGGHTLGTAADDEQARQARLAALERQQSSGSSSARAPLIRKLVGNVRDSPNEPKFRKVRLSNPKIGAALGGRPDAFALLCACGFTLDGSGEYAEMGDAAALDASALEWACASLDSAVAQAAAGGPPVPIGPSDVKVLVAPEGGAMRQPEVGEDFFALTPAEAKAIMDANAARRAKEDRFMTREAREAERAKQRRVYRKGMVRVRFPDGVVLQATFSSAAPVSAVLAWVAESLSVPAAFELAMAGAGPLSDLTATLEQAELCPASLLNFRVHAQEQMQPPYLRHELMQRLQVLEDEVIPVGSGGDAWAPQTMGAEGDGRPLARQRSSEERKQPAWFRPPQ